MSYFRINYNFKLDNTTDANDTQNRDDILKRYYFQLIKDLQDKNYKDIVYINNDIINNDNNININNSVYIRKDEPDTEAIKSIIKNIIDDAFLEDYEQLFTDYENIVNDSFEVETDTPENQLIVNLEKQNICKNYEYCGECNNILWTDLDMSDDRDDYYFITAYVHNEKICPHCMNEFYNCCDDCGEIYHIDDLNYFDGFYYCNDCLPEHAVCCDDCGDFVSTNDIYTTHDGREICENCRDNYAYCDDCDELYCIDDLHYCDDDDCYYCDDCFDSNTHNGDLLDYHDYDYNDYIPFINSNEKLIDNKNVIYKTDENSENKNYNLTLGIELETEKGNSSVSISDYIEKLNKNINTDTRDFIHYEHDGSLNNGVEIITQPFSYDYFINNYDKFEKITSTARSCNYQSHNGGRCGLHFHINKSFFSTDEKTQNDKINNFVLFTEFYKNYLQKFSRRENYHYCQFLSDEKNLTEKERKNTYYIDKFKNVDRYLVVNVPTYNRGDCIELRIMRGTLKTETFMASIEFVINLCFAIRDLNATSITWQKVVNYKKTKYLKNYLTSIGLKKNTQYMKDYKKSTLQNLNSLFKSIEKLKTDFLKEYEKIYNDTINEKNINTYFENIKNINDDNFNKIQKINDIIRDLSVINTNYASIKKWNFDDLEKIKDVDYYSNVVRCCDEKTNKTIENFRSKIKEKYNKFKELEGAKCV